MMIKNLKWLVLIIITIPILVIAYIVTNIDVPQDNL
jgi:hypothetical protein